MRTRSRVMLALIAALILSGCRSAEEYDKDRLKNANDHFADIGSRGVLPPERVLSLSECIDIAIKHNLDYKVFELKQKIADEKVTAEMLGMLPDLTISDDWTGRNSEPGSSSKSITSGGATYGASTSSDRNVNNLKIEMALSVLDFGLAYLNAAQAEDYSLIEAEQKRRAKQNLTMDVVKAYYEVAATQDAIDTTKALLEKCRAVDKVFIELAESKTVSPLRMMDERKRFIRLEKRLMEYQRNYNNACIQLRALLGFKPINEIKVDTAELKNLLVKEIPDVNLLEKMALVSRPELYQMDIQTHITVNEARKTILQMCPNVKIFTDFNNSSNSFLYNQSWWEIGARAAYNMLKLPQQYYRVRALESQQEEIAARTLALSIGVMSQVRIAQANIVEIRERFDLDDRVYKTYAAHVEAARKMITTGGALSKLELDRLELEAAETEIDRIISLSGYYVAYYRLINAVGVDNLNADTVEFLKRRIADAEAKEWAMTAEQEQAYALAQKNLQDTVKTFNGVVVGDNTLSAEQRQKLDALIPADSENKKTL